MRGKNKLTDFNAWQIHPAEYSNSILNIDKLTCFR